MFRPLLEGPCESRDCHKSHHGSVEAFDEFQQSLVFTLTIRVWFLQPSIETTRMDFKNHAHGPDREIRAMVTDKGVLYSGSLAK